MGDLATPGPAQLDGLTETLRRQVGECAGPAAFLDLVREVFEEVYGEALVVTPAGNERGRSTLNVLQTIIDHLPSGVTLFGPDLRMIACNERFKRLLDFPLELFADGLPDFATLALFNARRGEYGPGNPEALAEAVVARARRMEPHVIERARPDGTHVEIRGTPLPGGGFVSIYTDVTERHQAEQEIRRARDLMRDAIAYSPAYIWEIDADGRFSFVQGAEKILGYEPGELLGRHHASLHASRKGNQDNGKARAIEARRPFDNIIAELRRQDGTRVWVSSSGHPVHDAAGLYQGFRGVDVDVSEVVEARRAMERMALYDQLTGLANRHKFLQHFDSEHARQRRTGEPLSLLVVDIDNFKSVNDRHGHPVGDSCLQSAANVIATATRETDIAARFGGEEFVVLLPETGIEGAKAAAEKLRARMEDTPLRAQGATLHLTVSVGVATSLAEAPLDFDALFALADDALYSAKQAGRNRVSCAAMLPLAD